MAFRFTLAQVLRVRESIERREELALQRAELEVSRARRRIEELTDNLARAVKARDEAILQPIQAFELQCMNAEMSAIAAEREAVIATLQKLMQQRDAQRKVYQSAHTGRQMLTDMSTQQRAEYDQEQARAQQKRLDDVFAARLKRG
ncbi:MAG TPA: flagellar FliJ family protein [Terracidiphilus sp.]|nr:flagellar FliJ family protein [Terracidiphilus sp.]